MRRAAVPLAFLAITGCSEASFVERPEAKEGIAAAAPIIVAVEQYRAGYGSYPPSMDTVPIQSGIRKHANSKGIRYVALNHVNGYTVSFDFPVPPLRPRCTYGKLENQSKPSDWQCTGK